MSKDNRSDEEKVSEYISKDIQNDYMNSAGDKPGLIMVGIIPGGLAEKVGLKKFDRVLAMDGKAINTMNDCAKALTNRGETLTIDLLRGNQFKTIVLNYGIEIN